MTTYQIQSDPKRQFTGLAAVVLFHAIVIYALVSGLAKNVIDAVREPIEARLIEEPKPKPVVPPPKPVEPPKVKAPPPPAYVPPPQVAVAPAVTPPPIVATPVEPPKVEAPPPPPPVVAPRPTVVSLTVACPQQVDPVMPPRAEREGITGSVEARLTVKGGKVVAIDIVKSTPRGVFDEAVRQAVRQYGCVDNGEQAVVAVQQFEFASGG